MAIVLENEIKNVSLNWNKETEKLELTFDYFGPWDIILDNIRVERYGGGYGYTEIVSDFYHAPTGNYKTYGSIYESYEYDTNFDDPEEEDYVSQEDWLEMVLDYFLESEEEAVEIAKKVIYHILEAEEAEEREKEHLEKLQIQKDMKKVNKQIRKKAAELFRELFVSKNYKLKWIQDDRGRYAVKAVFTLNGWQEVEYLLYSIPESFIITNAQDITESLESDIKDYLAEQAKSSNPIVTLVDWSEWDYYTSDCIVNHYLTYMILAKEPVKTFLKEGFYWKKLPEFWQDQFNKDKF